jgi:hypothetical protein
VSPAPTGDDHERACAAALVQKPVGGQDLMTVVPLRRCDLGLRATASRDWYRVRADAGAQVRTVLVRAGLLIALQGLTRVYRLGNVLYESP